jgi:hypothetical protein
VFVVSTEPRRLHFSFDSYHLNLKQIYQTPRYSCSISIALRSLRQPSTTDSEQQPLTPTTTSKHVSPRTQPSPFRPCSDKDSKTNHQTIQELFRCQNNNQLCACGLELPVEKGRRKLYDVRDTLPTPISTCRHSFAKAARERLTRRTVRYVPVVAVVMFWPYAVAPVMDWVEERS